MIMLWHVLALGHLCLNPTPSPTKTLPRIHMEGRVNDVLLPRVSEQYLDKGSKAHGHQMDCNPYIMLRHTLDGVKNHTVTPGGLSTHYTILHFFGGEATYTTFNFAACHHVPMSTLNALDVVMCASWQSMSNVRRTCKDGNSRQKVRKAGIGI